MNCVFPLPGDDAGAFLSSLSCLVVCVCVYARPQSNDGCRGNAARGAPTYRTKYHGIVYRNYTYAHKEVFF